jgi:spermidine synthase
MRWIVAAINHWIPGRLNPKSLRVTHLGGGACSIARYIVAKYPASRNTVVELDGALGTLVRDWFDLPRSPQLKIRQGDARAVTETFVPASRDIIIRDVFAGAETPHNLTTVEFFQLCKNSLAPGGLYVANCGDHSDLKGAHAEIKGLEEVFGHVSVIADPAMLKGRRYGNIILLASESALPAGQDADAMARELLGGAVPAQYKGEGWTRKFAAAGTARHDET